MLAGDVRLADAITGRSATLLELADVSDFNAWRGGTLVASPVTAVQSLDPRGRLVSAGLGAIVRAGTGPVLRVMSRTGPWVAATGAHAFLTPHGYRPLADLAPGCEVALQWTGSDIFWDRIAVLEEVGEKEVFGLTVDRYDNLVAGGFVVRLIRPRRPF